MSEYMYEDAVKKWGKPFTNKKEKIAKKIKGGMVGELKNTIKNYHPKGKLSTKEKFEKSK